MVFTLGGLHVLHGFVAAAEVSGGMRHLGVNLGGIFRREAQHIFQSVERIVVVMHVIQRVGQGQMQLGIIGRVLHGSAVFALRVGKRAHLAVSGGARQMGSATLA